MTSRWIARTVTCYKAMLLELWTELNFLIFFFNFFVTSQGCHPGTTIFDNQLPKIIVSKNILTLVLNLCKIVNYIQHHVISSYNSIWCLL